MFEFLAAILSFFYQFTHSYGLSIVLLTVVVRLVLFPLTAKQMRSMAAMSRVQPQIKKMQAEYKDDRQKLNEEMMKFYKQEGINPAAGCFPLLLQLPVFFGLFRVIRGLSSTGPLSFLAVRVPKPDYLSKDSEMYRAIVRSGGQLLSWGFDLAQSASGTWGSSKATPYLILVLLYGASGWVQQSMANKRNMTQATGTAAQMQQIMKIFPIFMALFAWSMPAGLVVYWFASNLWTIGQQEVLYRTIPQHNPNAPIDVKDVKDTKDAKDGKDAKEAKDEKVSSKSSSSKTGVLTGSTGTNSSNQAGTGAGNKASKPAPNATKVNDRSDGKSNDSRAPKSPPNVGPAAKGTKTPTRNIPSSTGKKKGR